MLVYIVFNDLRREVVVNFRTMFKTYLCCIVVVRTQLNMVYCGGSYTHKHGILPCFVHT